MMFPNWQPLHIRIKRLAVCAVTEQIGLIMHHSTPYRTCPVGSTHVVCVEAKVPGVDAFVVPVIMGSVQQLASVSLGGNSMVSITLIARRSVQRPGVRHWRRGADAKVPFSASDTLGRVLESIAISNIAWKQCIMGGPVLRNVPALCLSAFNSSSAADGSDLPSSTPTLVRIVESNSLCGWSKVISYRRRPAVQMGESKFTVDKCSSTIFLALARSKGQITRADCHDCDTLSKKIAMNFNFPRI